MKLWLVLALLPAVAAGSGCNSREEAQASRAADSTSQPALSAEPTAERAGSVLTEVTDATQVCMVNDQFMGKAQIPVAVSGKTYYGCCEMCKGRLESDPKARTATDPVSGQPVDKATAVIGKNDQGAVHYFQSRENLLAYKP